MPPKQVKSEKLSLNDNDFECFWKALIGSVSTNVTMPATFLRKLANFAEQEASKMEELKKDLKADSDDEEGKENINKNTGTNKAPTGSESEEGNQGRFMLVVELTDDEEESEQIKSMKVYKVM